MKKTVKMGVDIYIYIRTNNNIVILYCYRNLCSNHAGKFTYDVLKADIFSKLYETKNFSASKYKLALHQSNK